MTRHLLLALIFVGLPVSPFCQVVTTDSNGQTLLKVTARTVLEDVVVTTKDGKPIEGLHKEDFDLTEDGHSQSLTSFSEHGNPMQVADMAANSSLPLNTFSNMTDLTQGGALTVLLLDSLNTPVRDQQFLHAQITKYLASARPGSRLAVFVLDTQLRFVQGFSDDVAALAAAIQSQKGRVRAAASSQTSSMQKGNVSEPNVDMGSEHAIAGAATLSAFLGEQQQSQLDSRIRLTLTAMQELAQYLAGFPGRKNVVWFTGSFPLNVFTADNDGDLTYGDLKRTDALLSAAQIAIYPVGASGLAASALFDAEHRLSGVGNAQQAEQQLGSQLRAESDQRNGSDAAMSEIAEETGGSYLANSNGLGDALIRAIEHGSRFYTLTYTPGVGKNDGQLRKITVKLNKADAIKGAHLAYRRGYFADDAKTSQALHDAAEDPLRPFMDLGMPASTQIPLSLHFSCALATGHEEAIEGDNAALSGMLTRYSTDFTIAAKDLQFDTSGDGSKHGRLEASLLVFNPQGKPLNWVVRTAHLDVNTEQFTRLQATGVHFRLIVDAPKSAADLRGGVYDLNAHRAGTLETAIADMVVSPAVDGFAGPRVISSSATMLPPSSMASVAPSATKSSTFSEGPSSNHEANKSAAPSSLLPTTGQNTISSNAAPAHPVAHKSPVTFWSLPESSINEMLRAAPEDNHGRYKNLREDFAAMHCSAYLIRQQPTNIGNDSNLVCTLPGLLDEQVLIVGRYERVATDELDEHWRNAVLLTVLHNALKSQVRSYTYVFVALCGAAGEKAFFDELDKSTDGPAHTLVILDGFGSGTPSIYTTSWSGSTKKSHEVEKMNKMLAEEAVVSAEILRMPSPLQSSESPMQGISHFKYFSNTILEREYEYPAIVIEAPAKPIQGMALRRSAESLLRDSNFLAYFLCRVDLHVKPLP